MHVFFLLEHQRDFESSGIVAYESLSCPRCEKMDLKIIKIFEVVLPFGLFYLKSPCIDNRQNSSHFLF